MPQLVELLLSNGRGRWFTACRWCNHTTPAIDCPDDLRILAAAKASGWRVYPKAGGGFHVVCRPCQRSGMDRGR